MNWQSESGPVILGSLLTWLAAQLNERRKAKVSEEKAKLDEQAQANAEEESEYKRLERLCDRLSFSLQTALDQRDKSDERHAEVQSRFHDLSEKYSQLTRNYANLQDHIEGLEQKVSALATAQEAANEKNEALEAANIRLRRQNMELQSLLDDARKPKGKKK